MNFNMTYGMAIAMRKIQDRIDLNVNEWENEENIEKTRIDVRRQSSMIKADQLQMQRLEEEVQEEYGFYFRNHLGIGAKLTIENFERIPDTVPLTDEHKDTAVI